MANFTVIISTYHYVEADDEIDALKAIKDAMPEGAGVQNVQVMPGTQQFSNTH